MSMLKDLDKKILGSTCVCVAHLLLHAYSWRSHLNNIPIYFIFNWPLKMYFVIVERRILPLLYGAILPLSYRGKP